MPSSEEVALLLQIQILRDRISAFESGLLGSSVGVAVDRAQLLRLERKLAALSRRD
jgi:hypothetical protein